MKRGLFGLLFGVLSLPAIAQNVGCYQQCATRGIDRNQCIAMCDQGLGSPPGQPGMYPPGAPMQGAQPGAVPRQPGAASPWQQPSQFNVNQACFENCREDGGEVAQCQQQCRY